MTNSKSQKHKVSEILKTSGIFHFSSDDTLSQALPKLRSSHDAAFVFDKKDNFIGVISPSFIFRSRSFNTQTKLKNVVKNPPKLKLIDNLGKVAERMINSKIYYLPVVNGKFSGIATINRLLSFVLKNRLIKNDRIVFSGRDLVVIEKDESISNTLNLMQKEKVDKFPVVDKQNKLTGFVSKYDLKDLIRTPIGERRNDRASEKNSNLDEPVHNYMNKKVVSINKIPTFSQSIKMMREQKVGSLVIVDRQNKPMSIVTKRDLLETVRANVK